MSFFSKSKETEVVLFSPLEGKITYQGEPAKNATIELWIAWKDEQGERKSFKTDENGNFSIPTQKAVYKDSAFAQLSVGQKITVFYQNQTFLIWECGKSSAQLYGELGGKPEGVICELTNDLDDHLDHALLGTNCRWEILKEVPEENE